MLTENLKDDAINEALSLTGVEHLKNKNLGNLSGGEFQRVLLARAISKKPELLGQIDSLFDLFGIAFTEAPFDAL